MEDGGRGKIERGPDVMRPLRAIPGPAVTTVRLLAIADRPCMCRQLHGRLSVIVIRFLLSLRLIE